MKDFNLEKALAGEKVITKDGRKVTQLTCFEDIADHNPMVVYGVVDGEVDSWTAEGFYHSVQVKNCEANLLMEPKKLSGFVNIYPERSFSESRAYNSRKHADINASSGRIACIGLSQFDEGHGL